VNRGEGGGAKVLGGSIRQVREKADKGGKKLRKDGGRRERNS